MADDLTSIGTNVLAVDERLIRAITASVTDTMQMCGRTVRCVGLQSVPSANEVGRITGMIGVHGNATGFIVCNAAEQVALKAVGGLLSESFSEVSSQVVDGMGEIANMMAGSIKARIANSSWAFAQMTTPSVIVGSGYQIAFGKGVNFLSVMFEHEDHEAVKLDDRLLYLSISLIRTATD